MLKKFFTGLAAAALLTFTTTTAFADANVSPYNVLPGDLDLVIELDLQKLPALESTFKELMYLDDSASFTMFMGSVLKNRVIFGASDLANLEDMLYESGEMYFAVKMSAQKFNHLKELIEEEEGEMTKQGTVAPFYCEPNDSCLGHFGGHLYLTPNAMSMGEVARNYYKQERDTLAQNQNFLEAHNAELRDSALSLYIDFEELLDEIMGEVSTELEDALWMYDGDSLMSLLMQTLEAVEFESISAEMSEQRFGLRTYVKYNPELLKKLPFDYLEHVFQPGLHTYFDGDGVIGYMEGSNLAAQAKMMFDLFEDFQDAQEAQMAEWFDADSEFYDEEFLAEYEQGIAKQRETIKTVERLTKLLNGKYAFNMSAPLEGNLPALTFLAEISRNRGKQAAEHIDALAATLKESIDEQNEWEIEWSGEDAKLATLESIDAGLYEVRLPLEEWEQEELGVTEIVITFGVNKNNMLVVSNAGRHETRMPGQNNKFVREVGSSGRMVGIGYLDFETLYNYLHGLDTFYGDDLNVLSYLDTLTMKSYFNASAVKTDFGLSYDEAGYNMIIEALQDELY